MRDDAVVKSFRADDARSALAAVKAALGPEAIIISTQEIPGGLFQRPKIEVTAARPSAPAAASAPSGLARYAAPSAPQPPAPAPPGPGVELLAAELGRLRATVDGMRAALERTEKANDEAPARFSPAVMPLYRQLLARGLEATLADELIRLAAGAQGAQGDALWKAVRELLAERLVVSRAPWLPGARRVIALVGPTGVGKTTTLAMIAARALVEQRLKVALITVDTYRIGAAEQVARYGALMNVPTHVARDAAELDRALGATSGAELVLIDTAGRSKPDEIARQAQQLAGVPGLQRYLCLSAASGGAELATAARRFAPLKPTRLVFTKLDEAGGPASILSALTEVPRPIACVTDGQRVPEDLHAFTSAQLVDLVTGATPPGR
ncbi:MAG: flagellar biosynthesis protein FlhF [Myxococcaceae bacterium]|nr:flagellar biosynthesis protein FlhF [Myxococcaceae bacterium]